MMPLGVTLYPHLYFSNHFSNLSWFGFMRICDLRRNRPMLDFKIASIIATSIVHSKLDYCNSLFLNLDSTQIQRLQLIQNCMGCHTTPVLKSLHWLKIPDCIHFNVLWPTTWTPHNFFTSTTVIANHKTSSSSSSSILHPSLGLPLKTKMFSSETPTLTRLIIHPPN